MSEEDLASPGWIGLADEPYRIEDLTACLPAPSGETPEATSSPAAAGVFDPPGDADGFVPPAGYAAIGHYPGTPAIRDLAAPIATSDDGSDDAEAGGVDMATSGAPAVRPPSRDDAPAPVTRKHVHGLIVATIACALTLAVGWHFAGPSGVCRLADQSQLDLADSLAAETVARRIVTAESGGDATARNRRSSASGSGQFLDGTWLDMIRAYRPDLAGRSDTEILDLKNDPDLSREMVARFAEENAAMLASQCLPVTPTTLYLSHFAGGAGAVAVLSAPEYADAAATMAKADASRRTTRDMIVTANPFIARFTVADLKRWAEHKMAVAGGDRLSRM